MQNEITSPSELLDDNGHLIQKGWARKLLLTYNREKVHAGWHRIKEWDYYAVLGPQYGITFTIADVGYLALCSIAWLDFTERTVLQETGMQMFPKGRLNLPRSSESGETVFKGKKISMKFVKEGNTRTIAVDCPSFGKGKGLHGNLILAQNPSMDTIVVATPFDKPTAFYYNQKINCMPAKGIITFQNVSHEFSDSESFACLDWGRGVWTYKNTWYWGSASGIVEGKSLGWNIGYGFGDLSTHTENIIFYDGQGHKFDQITFEIPVDEQGKEDFLKPWKLSSNDGRFEMSFEAAIDRASSMNLVFLKSLQHQVFGFFTGDVVLDDGKKIHVNRLLGFAEKVYNAW